MLAVAGGAGAALAFALVVLTTRSAGRHLDGGSIIAWITVSSLVILTPIVAVAGIPSETLDQLPLLAISGATAVGGLVLMASALRRQPIGVVAPLVTLQGAVAAVIAVIAGEPLTTITFCALALLSLGAALASFRDTQAERPSAYAHGPAIAMAFAAAGCFGVTLYTGGRASAVVPVWIAIAPQALFGAFALALPLAVRRRLRWRRELAPALFAAGVLEVVGAASFALGARSSIAIAGVLAGQNGMLAAVAGFYLYGERLQRAQLCGVLAIAIGVSVLSATYA